MTAITPQRMEPQSYDVTIAVCTLNRAPDLSRTLSHVQAMRASSGMSSECIVVDNGCTDETADVVEDASSLRWPIRRVVEPRRGVSRARNAALREALGGVIVFLDDDVVPQEQWLPRLVEPILSGAADAVAGSIRLPDSMRQPWMEPWHREWLGETLEHGDERPVEMYGANMAVGRHVTTKVPAFDPELGVGALGHGEEALYSYQVRAAGMRIVRACTSVVEHHPSAAHLTRESMIEDAVTRGRTMAYIHYHWSHAEAPHARKRALAELARLVRDRIIRVRLGQPREGLPRWEMVRIRQIAYLRQFSREIRRPRNYDRQGLVKLRGVLP